jgi:hypothetical protein
MTPEIRSLFGMPVNQILPPLVADPPTAVMAIAVLLLAVQVALTGMGYQGPRFGADIFMILAAVAVGWRSHRSKARKS